MPTKFSVLLAIGLSGLTAFGGNRADARSPRDQCEGVLHQKGRELWFGGERGEGESICVIAPTQVRKVLDLCAAGRYCRVAGRSGECEGSGECLEIEHVVAVSARKALRR